MHLVLAGFSESYDKVNIVGGYCGRELYLHALTATALDGEMMLTSNSEGYFPEERTTGTHCSRAIA